MMIMMIMMLMIIMMIMVIARTVRLMLGASTQADAVRFANTAYHGPEAIGGAGRARDKFLAAVILIGVDAHETDLGVVLDGGR